MSSNSIYPFIDGKTKTVVIQRRPFSHGAGAIKTKVAALFATTRTRAVTQRDPVSSPLLRDLFESKAGYIA